MAVSFAKRARGKAEPATDWLAVVAMGTLKGRNVIKIDSCVLSDLSFHTSCGLT